VPDTDAVYAVSIPSDWHLWTCDFLPRVEFCSQLTFAASNHDQFPLHWQTMNRWQMSQSIGSGTAPDQFGSRSGM
jgi:hypothetical protein